MYTPTSEPGFHLYNGPSIHARSVFFLLLSLALMITDSHYSTLKTLRSAIELALAPVKGIVQTPIYISNKISFYTKDRADLIKENEDLLQQLLLTGYAEQRLSSLQEENAQLKELLNVRKMPDQTLLTVEVLESGTDPFLQKVTIDKGSSAGVTEGAAVLDPYGVVGQVTRVMFSRAEVTLIVERNFMIPIRNERNGKRGILSGAGAGKPLELRFVTADADPRVGDRLVTSGLDNIYPLGLSVAVITAVQPNAEALFINVTATPTAHISDERYLLVVRSENPEPVDRPVEAQSPTAADQEATPKPEINSLPYTPEVYPKAVPAGTTPAPAPAPTAKPQQNKPAPPKPASAAPKTPVTKETP
ncbi:MAG: rod shape-determining protein MreC [Burkholderiales bacterium]|jgi:rod shape-determining protein MreC|nr:rod shape-determining protein MreC [Burkholderiales bacterium]